MSFELKDDTICACATPFGEGGIGIIRISGPEALAIARSLFRPRHPDLLLQSHRLTYGWILTPQTGERIDEVLLSYMAAPNTYTREDTVEINCHGGPLVLSRVLELVRKCGARLAEPGEFTRRAFLNGRIDLSQAEAVIDLIRSRSERSLALAGRQLHGELRDRVGAWRHSLLDLQAHLDALIDFADEMDEPLEQSLARLDAELIAPLTETLAHADEARLLREGIRIALVGTPNVGKSSLLNALAGHERAIVTPFAGTTRDVVDASFTLSGVLVTVLDTAGIRHDPEAIERLGIARSLQAAEEADLILWLIDGSRPLGDDEAIIFDHLRSLRYVVLLNKADLPTVVEPKAVRARFDPQAEILHLSALRPGDIERLRSCLAETLLGGVLVDGQVALGAGLRHKEQIERALAACRAARELLIGGNPAELISFELDSARRELEAILGLEVGEAVLDRIFSQFCIGK